MTLPTHQPDPTHTPATLDSRARRVRDCLKALMAERRRATRRGRPLSPGNCRRLFERRWHDLEQTLATTTATRRARLRHAMWQRVGCRNAVG